MHEDEGMIFLLLGIALLTVLSLAYSVFVIHQPFLWIGVVVPLGMLYLAWRLVRAAERIATAMEKNEA